ncbi:hyaluronidase [Tamilnaduibacter salinus]|uniref:Hyaluronidase n=1 Tax=Tamilnaduibacter salinus TaxID=1484056 RepID=A0A2A2I4Q6_9GAMM|nr:beta-N-acetylglucosaminidase domain-containing protein [Tamilnaduibacter salinus]PAV26719.1 hyaluronidase [Tamilnaduibacter salinus]
MTPPLGIIEGFYGPFWSWGERRELVTRLAPAGYHHYLYAPKADACLRRRWQEPHPPEHQEGLRSLAEHCHGHGVRFGIGLSPFEVFQQFDDRARRALADKLAFFDDLGIDDLAILFDDMSGDTPDLARRQADILHWVQSRTGATRLMVCPTYYSDDPVLDRVFGERPAGYLEALGEFLAPDIDVFWTGEEVCSRDVSPGHLDRIATRLGRRPMLWDNYPVNDGDRMSQHLHLRGFSGRPAANSERLSAHFINPALQPTLTAIPALTLADSYRQGEAYEYGRAFAKAAASVLGDELADLVRSNLLQLEDAGLSRMTPERRDELAAVYQAYDHPGAREIVRWLQGQDRVTPETVQTQ